MRFKFVLPLLQTIAMLVILWVPWAPGAHKFDIVLRDGREFKGWTIVPDLLAFDTVAWAEGVNLPALPIVAPFEYAVRRADHLPNYLAKFFGLWLIGLLCWYMVGRLLDDVLSWRRGRFLPKKHSVDLVFALMAAPSAYIVAAAAIFGGTDVPGLKAWGIVWVVVMTATLIFRLLQVIRQRRRVFASLS